MSETYDPLAFMDEPEQSGGEQPSNDEASHSASDLGSTEGDDKGTQEAPEGGEDTKTAETTPEAPAGKEGADAPNVPLPVYLDEREKRQRAEAALEAAKPADAVFVPPTVGTPEYQRMQEENFAVTILNERLNNSERWARMDHEPALVDTVRDWALGKFEKDPAYAARVLYASDPYKIAIEDYNKEQLDTAVSGWTPSEVEAFRAWKASQGGDGGSTTETTQPNPLAQKPASREPARMPRSIADDTSAGGAHAVATGPGQAFDSVFKN